MPSPRFRLGLSAQTKAAEELGKCGYRIVDWNWHCRYGEIDLIAYDGDTLVFVEVRSKKNNLYGTPAESITPSKQQKLLKTAQSYLLEKNLNDVYCRFDVVEASLKDGKPHITEIIKDAFS